MKSQLVVKVCTDKGLCLEKSADFCRLPGKKGDIGITSGHTASLLECNNGEIVIKTSQNQHVYFMSNAIVHIENDDVTILTSYIEAFENIDKKRALSSKERSIKRLADIESGRSDASMDVSRVRASLNRAEIRLEILSKHANAMNESLE